MDLVALPAGSTVLAICGCGFSNWTGTARVDTLSIDGVEKSYFLKVAPGDRGPGMMLGEYESMMAIYDVVPTFVPRPIAWGTFEVIVNSRKVLRAWFIPGCNTNSILEQNANCASPTKSCTSFHATFMR